MRVKFDDLPAESLVGARDICRTRNGPGIVPHGKTNWTQRVRQGQAPAPVYLGGQAFWTVAQIRDYLKFLHERSSPTPPQQGRTARLRCSAAGEAEQVAA